MKKRVFLISFVLMSLLNLDCASSEFYRYKSEEQVPASDLSLALNTFLSIRSINNTPLSGREMGDTLNLFYINPGRYEISATYSSNRGYSTNSKIISFDVQKAELVILCAVTSYQLREAGYNANSDWVAFAVKTDIINLEEHKSLFGYNRFTILEKFCIPEAKAKN